MDLATILNLLEATIRLATPLLFAALAGLYSERAGVFDISLEGKMLAAAFASASVAALGGSVLAPVFAGASALAAWLSPVLDPVAGVFGASQAGERLAAALAVVPVLPGWASPVLGLGAGILVAVAFSLVHGLASITYRGNQIVSGVALNFVAAGLTIILGSAWFGQGGRTPPLAGEQRFGDIALPGAEALAGVPVLGPIYAQVISGHNILVYLAFLAVPLTWFVLFRTRFGLRLRAVGENPAAVDTAGISVAWLRYRAVIICGVLCGFAGTYMAVAQAAGFNRDMTAGKGYIALAALIFAKWKPVPVLFACLLFGFLDAFSIRIQGLSLPVVGVVSQQFVQALPYILTVVLLAGFVGKAVPPKAGGVPYVKER